MGNPSARTSFPALRHRRHPAGRAASAGAPGPRRHDLRPAAGGRRPDPGGPAADRQGSGRPQARGPARRRHRPLEQVVEALAAAAYHRTDLVEKRGEFAVRGGILDVFPPTEGPPGAGGVLGTRSRRSAGSRSPISAAWRSPSTACGRPCRELLLTDQVRERADAPRQSSAGSTRHAPQDRRRHRRRRHGVPRARPARGHGDDPRRAAGRRGHLVDPERVRTRAHDLVATSQEFLEAGWANAASGNAVPIDLQEVLGSSSYWSMAQLREHAAMIGLRGGTSAPSTWTSRPVRMPSAPAPSRHPPTAATPKRPWPTCPVAAR